MSESAPAEVVALATERVQARADKDWARSDELRELIAEAGWKVVDTPDGFELSPRPPFEVAASMKDLLARSARSVHAALTIGVIVDGYPDDVRTCLDVMRRGRVLELTDARAVAAAEVSTRHNLAMADAVMYSLAQEHGATFWTQDIDYQGLPDVHCFAKS